MRQQGNLDSQLGSMQVHFLQSTFEVDLVDSVTAAICLHLLDSDCHIANVVLCRRCWPFPAGLIPS